jgi:hypothetical protein
MLFVWFGLVAIMITEYVVLGGLTSEPVYCIY